MTARATREVIVSGGVYGSPQLLMLSGLGPAAHLQQHGIAVIRDMPGVGSHLHDHFNTYVAYRCAQPVTMNDLVLSLPRRILAGAQYALGRTGPLASMGLYVGALVRSDKRLERPDLQINMFAWAIKDRDRNGVVPQPFSAFGLSPVHLRPDGRGTVRLKSPDPLAAPEIRFNFLKSAYDFEALIHGMRLCREIARAAGARSPSSSRRSCPAPRSRATPSSRPTSAPAASPTCTRWAPAAWAARPTRWSTRSSASTASARSGSPTPRSCRRSSPATPMRPRIMIGEKCADMVRAATNS